MAHRERNYPARRLLWWDFAMNSDGGQRWRWVSVWIPAGLAHQHDEDDSAARIAAYLGDQLGWRIRTRDWGVGWIEGELACVNVQVRMSTVARGLD